MSLIFANAVTFNESRVEQSSYSRTLVRRCKHMAKYINWLAQEYLPSSDDSKISDEQAASALGKIRYSIRDVYRKERLELISNHVIDKQGNKECMSLIKRFEQKKYFHHFQWFCR